MSYGNGNGNASGKRNGNGYPDVSHSHLIDPSLARQFDRLPPSDIPAEMCTLASCMLDKEMIGQVVQIIDRESFFQADHQIIYDVLVKLYEQNRPIDAVIVREELAKRQLLEEVGGTAYLAQILNTVPSAAHGAHYACIVREKALLRQYIAALNDGLRDAYAPHECADVILERGEKRIFQLAQNKAGQAAAGVSMSDILAEAFEQFDRGAKRGMETGFFELDDMLNGLQDAEMIVVAARPSIGKTALCMNFVENFACNNLLPCGIFSLEMSRQQLAQRLLCSRAQIDSQKLRRGMLRSDEYAKLAEEVAKLSQAPIFVVDDQTALKPLELRARARRMKLEHDIRFLLVDYLQLMDGDGNDDGRQQEITTISRTLKSVARELNVPVVAVSQLNRQVEGRDGHRPRMSDLRESGSIEQDADVVMLLHRDDYYRKNEPDFQPDNLAELIVAKQRNGPTGVVKLTFFDRFTRFENLSCGSSPF